MICLSKRLQTWCLKVEVCLAFEKEGRRVFAVGRILVRCDSFSVRSNGRAGETTSVLRENLLAA